MDFQAILMTVIAFSAVISVLGVIFHWLLTPVKDSIIELKNELRELRKEVRNLGIVKS